MKTRLAVGFLIVTSSMLLAACAGPQSAEVSLQSPNQAAADPMVAEPQAQSSPLQNAAQVDTGTGASDISAASSEPLDAELGCSAGGHIEYGLVPTRMPK